MGEPAEYIQPVIHADDHHPLLRHGVAVEEGFRGGTVNSTTTINPDQDRQSLIIRSRRCPDVEVEAVLAALNEASGASIVDPVPGPLVGGEWSLHARRPETIGGANALPWNDRLGFLPAQIADRGRGERNSEILADSPSPAGDTGDQPAFDSDRFLNGCRQRESDKKG